MCRQSHYGFQDDRKALTNPLWVIIVSGALIPPVRARGLGYMSNQDPTTDDRATVVPFRRRDARQIPPERPARHLRTRCFSPREDVVDDAVVDGGVRGEYQLAFGVCPDLLCRPAAVGRRHGFLQAPDTLHLLGLDDQVGDRAASSIGRAASPG